MQLEISSKNLKSFAILFSSSGAIIGFWCSIPLPVQNFAKHCAPKRFAAKTLYNKTLCSKTICSKTLCSKTHRCKRFKKCRNCVRADLVSLGKQLSFNIFLFLSLVSFHLILFWACVTSRLISFDLFLVSGNCNTSRLSDFKDLFSSKARQRFEAAKSLIWGSVTKCWCSTVFVTLLYKNIFGCVWRTGCPYECFFGYNFLSNIS